MEKITSAPSSPHRAGVVAMVGPPNAGKSTLLNRLLGQKIAIVSPLPQTTRNRILGVISGNDHQIIMLDTPGIHRARSLMNREMVRIALGSLQDADVVLLLDDGSRGADRPGHWLGTCLPVLQTIRTPVVLAINKIDLLAPARLLARIGAWSCIFSAAAVVPVSALHGHGVEDLRRELISRLPEGPRYYPDEMPTDATERFLVAEIIREKIFLFTRQEVPYGSAVLIDSFQEGKAGRPVVIHASIMVERGSQKGIIIGRRGSMLAKIRQQARHDIVRLLGCQVSLRLWVKVRKKWTRNEQILRDLGME